jgi:hypothetical protein
MSLAGLGETKLALKLAGAVKAEWERIGVDIHVRFWDALLERYLGAAKQSLGQAEANMVWTEGSHLSFAAAVTLALASV